MIHHRELMKKTVSMILVQLLTCVWSIVCAGLYNKQSSAIVSSTELTLCVPCTFPIGTYELAFPNTDSVQKLQLEYFDMLHCTTHQANLLLLPSYTSVPILDTICAGDTYTWNGNTYTKSGTYTDTLTNIHGCDSIVALHLEVLPDPPMTFTVNGVSFKMMRVRAGTFMMGATPEQGADAQANEKPAHKVTLTRDYFVSETVLTQELWTAVMGTTIQEEEAKGTGEKNLGYGPNYPMYCLSHNDCLLFVEQLNQLTGLTFRMPTEAEWEYAARGGHLSRGYKYPGSNNPLEVAWSIENDPKKKLHAVKLLKPNELGLYDMAGNVWEYIYDDRRTYTAAPQVNPMGNVSGNNANIRGGSTAWDTGHNRVSYRHIPSVLTKDDKSGRRAFRFVLDADRVIGEDNTTYQSHDTICAGETYTWNGNTYTKPGTYTDTLTNIHGCDSIVALHLEVLPDPPMTFTVNGVSFKMMRVRAGTFMMGSTEKDTDAEADEFPQHGVTLTKDFFIAETEMTQALWQAIMGNNPSADKSNLQSPVNMVSWDDCQEMIDTLNQLTGLSFRLPTEAEWEYAARGGQYSKGYKYAGSDNIDEVAWYNQQKYASVASLKPNELGIYDMSGNVYEWCQDWYNPKFYSSPTHSIDPFQAESLDGKRCLRGGSNKASQGIQTKKYSRIGNRGHVVNKTKESHVGIRLALEATGILENNHEFVINATICAGDSYTWNGNTYTKTGSYTDTLQNIYGCDSIVTLHLQVNPTYEVHDTVVACNSYFFNPFNKNGGGITIYESGTYKDTTANTNGCDSVEVLHLIVLPPTKYLTFDTLLCHGVTCEWRGLEFENAGTYNDTIKNQLNCDSIIYILNLAYLPDVVYVEQDTLLCYGTTCLWRGLEFENAGIYNNTVKNQLDCDSVIYILNLKYLPDVVYVEQDTLLCHGTTCLWRGLEFESAGIYNDTVKNQLDCDSIIYVLNLEYLPDVVYVEEDTLLCHGTTCLWRDLQLTTAGIYNDTVKNQLNCDSIIYILNLEYLPDVVYIEQDTLLCHGVTCEWRGLEFENAGTYNDTVKNQLDCDSIIYILNLEYLPNVVYVEEDTLLCYGTTCLWRGLEFENAGIYNDTVKNQLNCDSIIYVLNLAYLPDVAYVEQDTLLCHGVTCEWRGLEFENAGTYNDTVKNQLDCDSVVYILNLEYLPDVVYVEKDTLLCHGTTCLWRGLEFENAGIYNDTVKNQLNCDSVIYILNLAYLPDVVYVEEDTLLCHGVTCEWRGLEVENAGTYNNTVKNQLDCDSVVYILNLEYLPDVVYVEKDTLLCHGTTCLWRGLEFENAGIYNDTVKNQLNCDSVIYILNLAYLPDVVYVEEDTLLCHGVTCEWRGLEVENAGTYNDTVKNQLDCDSIIYVLNLEYLPDVVYVEQDTLLCHGVTCEWRGLEFESAGIYSDTVKNQLNCDSVIYSINLNYLPDVVYVEQDTLLCHGVTCEWRGLEFESAGTYNDTVKNQLDCDSIIYILNLEYLPDVVYVEQDTLLCHGVTCEWRGLEFENAGIYSDTVKNQLDCDSIIYILNLEYLPDVVYIEEDTLLCHGVTCEWRGLEFESAGTYNDTIKNQLNCDSVIYILNLAYLPQVQHFTTDTFLCYGEICDWREVTYAESGTYHDTIRNILRCDSLIYTLNLVIYPEIPLTHVVDTMAGAEYIWNGQVYTQGGDYYVTLSSQLTGCDSVVALHLTANHAAIDTVIVYEQCAGSGEQEIEILTRGYIEKIALRYSPMAQEAGLQDTVMPISSTNDIYTIHYDSVRAGIHKVTAVGLFHNEEMATYQFAFTYLYPNTIFEQRYNDLIAVLTHDYNGGYDFTAFQWYKDGVILHGETHSYLNQPLIFDSEYSVLLTNTDGLQLMSCPIIAEDRSDLSVYPTLIKNGAPVICKTTQPIQLCVYHSSGVIIQEHNLQVGKNQIYLPPISGVYLLLFKSEDSIERNVKVIVE